MCLLMELSVIYVGNTVGSILLQCSKYQCKTLKEWTVILFKMKSGTKHASLTLSHCSILTNTRTLCCVQEVCPAARHRGKGVQFVQPVRHHDACVHMWGPESVTMTRRTKDTSCFVLTCPRNLVWRLHAGLG